MTGLPSTRRPVVVALVLANAALLLALAASDRTSYTVSAVTLSIELLIALIPAAAVRILATCLVAEMALLVSLPFPRAVRPQTQPAAARIVHRLPPASAIPDLVAIDERAVRTGEEIVVGPIAAIRGRLRYQYGDALPPTPVTIGVYFSGAPEHSPQLVATATVPSSGEWDIRGVRLRPPTAMHQDRGRLAVVAARDLPETLDDVDLRALAASTASLQVRIRQPSVTLTTVCDRPLSQLAELPNCAPLVLRGTAADIYDADVEKLCIEIEGVGAHGRFVSTLYGSVRQARWSASLTDRESLPPARWYSLKYALVPPDHAAQSCDGFLTASLATIPAGAPAARRLN